MEDNKLVTLKLIDFTEKQRNTLSAILTLAARMLKKKWLIVSTDEADFFLFSVQAGQKLASDENLKKFPPSRSLFCSTVAQSDSSMTLLVDEQHVPSLSVLVSLFNQVGAKTAQLAATGIESAPSAAVSSVPENQGFFDTAQGVLGLLLTAEQEQFFIRLANEFELYIDTVKNAYYSPQTLEELSLYLGDFDQVTVQSCTRAELEQIVERRSLKTKPLKDLIWCIAIKTSAGKLLKGHNRSDIVSLKNWPDLRWFKCIEYAKIAAFMKKNAATLALIAEHTQMPITEVHNFYNACYLVGLIEKRNQLDITKKELPPERLEILSKINARLK